MSATPTTFEEKSEERYSDSQFSQSGVYDVFHKGSSTEISVDEKSEGQELNEVIKSEEDNMVFMLPQGMYSIIKSEEAILVTRTHYTKDIILELNWIAENHLPSHTNAVTGFGKLFNFILDYTTKSPKDPFTSLLRSIYQGLVFEDKWLTIEGSVYNKVAKLLKGYNNRKNLSFDDIDGALIKLEKLGINPTPF